MYISLYYVCIISIDKLNFFPRNLLQLVSILLLLTASERLKDILKILCIHRRLKLHTDISADPREVVESETTDTLEAVDTTPKPRTKRLKILYAMLAKIKTNMLLLDTYYY